MVNDKDLGQWRGIAVYLEPSGAGLSELSLEVVSLALELGRASGQDVYGILPVDDEFDFKAAAANLPQLAEILLYQSGEFRNFRANIQASALIDALENLRPSVVLIGASDQGKDLAPLAAAYFKTGLTADCTRLEITADGNLLQTRPAFGGNVMADILTPATRPQFATVRRGLVKTSLKKAGDSIQVTVRRLPESGFAEKMAVLDRRPIESKPSITEAKILIAAGGGIKSESDLGLLEALARQAGAMLGSTRGLVEKGWMPPDSQIGLSGHSVAPDLLITLGVSGSVQFLAGIGGAKYLMAVNNDPEARIFSVSHMGLCVDLYEVLPILQQKLGL